MTFVKKKLGVLKPDTIDTDLHTLMHISCSAKSRTKIR